MKRISALALAALLLSAPVAWGWCLNCTRIRPIPPEPCGPCPEGCKHGICPTLFPGHGSKAIHTLQTSDNFAARVCAVETLGCALHADPCNCPEVFEALIGALQCDPAWEVRRAAAISIRHQHLICRNALMALYIASRTDPHFTVRFKAAESLDILTVPYAPACFKEMRKEADALIVELRKQGYKPGSSNCRVLLGDACSHCGVASYLTAPAPVVSATAPATGPTAGQVVVSPTRTPTASEVVVSPDRAPVVIQPAIEPIAPPKGR